MLLTVALVVLTTLTFTPRLVTSQNATENMPLCSVDTPFDSENTLMMEPGQTTSFLSDGGLSFTTYTCDENATVSDANVTFCGDGMCIDPINEDSRNGTYNCTACENLYDTKKPCEDAEHEAEKCTDAAFGICYAKPLEAYNDCCKTCRDNTPATSSDSTTEAAAATTEDDGV